MGKAYLDTASVAGYMGRTLTTDQVALATTYIEQATQLIDRVTRRGDPLTGAAGWLNGAIVGEQYELTGTPNILLRCVPVVSVEAVTVRSHKVGDLPTTLTQSIGGSIGDYELQDPLRGLLVFANSYGLPVFYDDYSSHARIGRGPRIPYAYAEVSYTPNQPVPADLSLACGQIVAHWLLYNINPGWFGLSEIRTASQMYKFATQNGQIVLPLEAITIIGGYERHFF